MRMMCEFDAVLLFVWIGKDIKGYTSPSFSCPFLRHFKVLLLLYRFPKATYYYIPFHTLSHRGLQLHQELSYRCFSAGLDALVIYLIPSNLPLFSTSFDLTYYTRLSKGIPLSIIRCFSSLGYYVLHFPHFTPLKNGFLLVSPRWLPHYTIRWLIPLMMLLPWIRWRTISRL